MSAENHPHIKGDYEYEYILEIDNGDVIIKHPTHTEKILRTLRKIKTHMYCCRKKTSVIVPEPPSIKI